MKGIPLTVTEDKPIVNRDGSQSIVCTIVETNGFLTIGHGGQNYFVCNERREIKQYFDWMEREGRKAKLKKLGYTFV